MCIYVRIVSESGGIDYLPEAVKATGLALSYSGIHERHQKSVVSLRLLESCSPN